jgi:formylglycine-generating enzyme required for sulfatase activity
MTQVFISYSRKDLSFVSQLVADLKKAGFDVWYDVSGLGGGSRWRSEIENALRRSQFVLVVLSPDSIASEWVEREFLFASNLRRKIVPLMYRSCELPLNYVNLNYIDVQGENYRQNFEKLLDALDVRAKNKEEQPVDNKRSSELSKRPIFLISGGTIILATLVSLYLIINRGQAGYTPTENTAQEPSTELGPTPTETLVPTAFTPTENPTPTVTLLPAEITDTQNVTMRLIPAGSFVMGTNVHDALVQCQKYVAECDESWFEDESPPHMVKLGDFYIDRTEVTNGMYRECATTGVCLPPLKYESSTREKYYGDSLYDGYPVMNVTWTMAKEYCEAWRDARLPTEAEWEKAARGTDGRVYPWGNDFVYTAANYCDVNCSPAESNSSRDDGYKDTAPVGHYPQGQSFYGLYDMAGNVWEWIFDLYQENYYVTLADDIFDPQGPPSSIGYVLRGGAASTLIHQLRSSARIGTTIKTYADYYVGFRCAKDAP